jgi:predicted AlkP superfamily phosphohydrolase/phosphomutase
MHRWDGEAGTPVIVDPDVGGERAKLLLIGLDGATWEVLEPLMEAGRLPTFRMLVETGSSGPLRSMRPTKSPIIWTSIATGKDYLHHGITDFVVYPVPGLRRPLSSFPFCPGVEEAIRAAGISTIPITSTLRSEKAFWNILSENGRTVGVIGWWGSWPAEPGAGFMVSDRVLRWTSGEYGESRAIVYPDSLFEAISTRVRRPDAITPRELERFVALPEPALEAVVQGEYGGRPELPERSLELLKVSYNTDRWKSEIGGWLRERFDPDVFAVYFAGIDAAEHGFWKWREPDRFPDVREEDVRRYGDVIDNYCVYIDGLVGALVRSAGEETTVMLFSDHGHHVNRAWKPGSAQYGAHEDAPDGIFIARGRDIRRGRAVRGASIYDILPTILYAAGLPGARDLPGRVLEEVFEPDRLREQPPRFVASYGPRSGGGEVIGSASDPEVKERLRALGYLQ